ncbi:hypothetical protein NQZ68_002623 [Dissostichus eleginoides]|nr:hypothetical protein NQZ68_002623 [Dissostichus eleginoides]
MPNSSENTGSNHGSSHEPNFSFPNLILNFLRLTGGVRQPEDSSPPQEPLASISPARCVMQIGSNIKRPR